MLCWFIFFDGGNVFVDGENIKFNDLCYLVGVGISWVLLIGLLKFSFGKLLNLKVGDKF